MKADSLVSSVRVDIVAVAVMVGSISCMRFWDWTRLRERGG